MEALHIYIAQSVKGAFRLGASTCVLPSSVLLNSCVVVFSVKAVLLLAPREAGVWPINVYKGQNPVKCHDIFGPMFIVHLILRGWQIEYMSHILGHNSL